MLDRRQFLIGSASLLAAASIPHSSYADTATTAVGNAVTVTFDPTKTLAQAPANFTGLSYEAAQLGNSALFSADNKALVGFFQGLTSNGVLRIGGNSSEYCDWGPDATTAAASTSTSTTAVPPDTGQRAKRRTTITPDAITNLAGFLNATGWDLLYGVNLGTGTPQEAADEAAAVASAVGKRLIAFQIGNEPDLYSHNGLRSPDWKFDDYWANWNEFADAITKSVPNAAFAGPDVASNVAWIEDFARGAKSDITLLTGHYYAGGPPSNPDMDIPHLLRDSARVARDTPRIMAAAQAANLPFRMSEGNSCYNGGKVGVSDTFASALWAANYMLRLASAGYAGVNFHGGGSGTYTPIAGSLTKGFTARPIYYGLMLASHFAGTTLIAGGQSAGATPPIVKIDAYAGVGNNQTRIALINRDLSQPATVTVQIGGSAKSANVWRLSAPTVDSTSAVKLAGAEVASNGAWSALAQEVVSVSTGAFTIDVPAASALIAFAQ